jgi:uncharacterized protein YacL (UPF0231 family)
MIRANQLEFSGDEMEEGMNYYDEESLSLCGHFIQKGQVIFHLFVEPVTNRLVVHRHSHLYHTGNKYTLWLDGEEVMIRANQLEFSGDEMEEGMNYYDEKCPAALLLAGPTGFRAARHRTND